MKLLFANFTNFWGGGESWTYLVMSELKKRNHSIVLFSHEKGKLRLESKKNGIETYGFKVGKFSYLNIGLLIKLKKRIQEIKPDAIILNSPFELKMLGFLIKSSGCTKVVLTRGIPRPIKNSYARSYLFSKVVSDVIVNSNHVKESVSGISQYLKNESEVIYHGIETDSCIQSVCNTKNIAIVGRLSNEKGIDYAIEVMQQVLQSQPEAKLWIIGDGKEKNKLIHLCSELGIQSSVVFHGFVAGAEVEKLLVQCSMLIMTSRWEGFGLVLLEAMKLRLPCLAFDHLAANEIIIDNETGFLIPGKSISNMADKVIYLLSNPDVGQQLGENGRKLLQEKFSIQQSIDEYERVLMNNIGNSSRRV